MELLTVGDVFELTPDMKIGTNVPNHFLYSNRVGDWTLSHGSVHPKGVFDYMLGNYVVTRTAKDGGGTGHGPGDVYPDGHHIWAQNVDNENIKIDFYQTGCFTNMHRDLPVIGKAKAQKWSWERTDG